MNGYERIRAVFSGTEVDRVPVMLHNFMPAVREAGLTMNQFRNSPEKMADVFIHAARKYGLDGILTDVDTALEAHALGAVTSFPEDVPAKVVAPASNRLDELIDMVTPEKLVHDERIQIYVEAIRQIRHEVGNEIFIRGNADQGPFSLAAAVYDMTNLMLDMMAPEKEQLLHQLIERCYQVHLSFHLMMRDAGADMTSFGDSMGSPDLISPKLYDKFVAPYQKRLVDELAQNGITTVCHICGNTDRILQQFAEIRFAGVDIDSKATLEKVEQTMRGKSIVLGVIDPTGIFFQGNRDRVERETRRVLEIFGGTGIIPGSGCALPAETPAENIQAFVDTVHSFVPIK